jgi:hypothetical protein
MDHLLPAYSHGVESRYYRTCTIRILSQIAHQDLGEKSVPLQVNIVKSIGTKRKTHFLTRSSKYQMRLKYVGRGACKMERARQMLNGTGIRVWQVKEGERAEGVILRTWTNKTVVEFLTIQVSVTGGCPDLDVLTVHIHQEKWILHIWI